MGSGAGDPKHRKLYKAISGNEEFNIPESDAGQNGSPSESMRATLPTTRAF
jgi:hypothetical protein